MAATGELPIKLTDGLMGCNRIVTEHEGTD
jgi:hypothetical protein